MINKLPENLVLQSKTTGIRLKKSKNVCTYKYTINNFDTDELNSFISNLNCKPNIIGISECDLKKDNLPLSIINLPYLYFEFIPAESKKGCTITQIQKNLRYKLRKGLNIYKPQLNHHLLNSWMIRNKIQSLDASTNIQKQSSVNLQMILCLL